jgi:hypothetical protein
MATVVAANFLYLAGLPSILDPMISMEPFYIQMAQRPVATILAGDPAWGPLFALWLKPFVILLGDPLAVYTANLYALSVCVSVLIYVYLLLLTRRAAVAVGAALFFLVCDLNVPLFSKVCGFALMMALTGLTVSELVPPGAPRVGVAALGVLLASYARPELYPAALCLCAASVWLALRQAKTSGWRVLCWPSGVMIALLVPVFSMGTPLDGPAHGNDRLLMAFREHFARNWTRWHNEGGYFLAIWQREFGDAQTPLQAVLHNPRVAAHHLADNLLGALRFMVTSVFNHYPLLAPATQPYLMMIENALAAGAAFGGLLLVAARRDWRRQMRARYGHLLLPYAVLLGVAFLSATAIFPAVHYLVIPAVLLMVAGALAATLIIPCRPDYSRRTCVLAALACLVAVPRPFVLPSAYVVPGSPFKGELVVERTIIDTIAFIRALELPPPVAVLTVTDGIGEMLGAGFHEIKIWERGAQPLESYVRDKNVAVIVALEAGRQSFIVDDPYWMLLQISPDAAGFTLLSVPNHERVRVYVRADLRKPALN